MTINFLINALPKDSFLEFLSKNDEELKISHGAWLTVDADPGYPCRVSLSDAKVGESTSVIFLSS